MTRLRLIHFCLTAVVFSLVLQSCAGDGQPSGWAAEAAGPRVSWDSSPPKDSVPQRQMVRNGTLKLRTRSVEKVTEQVQSIVQEMGGYVESVSVEQEEEASVSLRVPSKNLDAFLDRAGEAAEVKGRYISAEDVTDQVADIEARLANLRTLRDRLRDLSQRGQNVADLVEVERELARVQGEIEMLETQQRRVGNDIAMSKVTVHIEKKHILGPVGFVFDRGWWAFSKLFVID